MIDANTAASTAFWCEDMTFSALNRGVEAADIDQGCAHSTGFQANHFEPCLLQPLRQVLRQSAVESSCIRMSRHALISLFLLRCLTEGGRDMKNSPKFWPMISALTISLAGIAAGGMAEGATHLSATQCRDLAAIKNHAPVTQERNQSELAALRKAGYDPSRFDPHYPKNLQAAQHQVDRWYQAECPQARHN